VDCIHPRKDEPEYEQVDMLHIDPENCIDCGACVPVCPVSVIYAADDLPEQLKSFLEVNAAYFAKAH
jgi:ferredoxin